MAALCGLAAGWMAGLILFGTRSLGAPWLLAAGALGWLGVRLQAGPAHLVLLALSAGLLSAGGLGQLPVVHTARGGTARLTVDIERTACGVRSCWAEATLRACRDVDPDACVPPLSRVAISSHDELAVGARVAVLARMQPLFAFRNPTPAWSWPWPGVVATAVVADGIPARIERSAWLGSLLVRGRQRVRTAFVATLSPPHDGIARALLLGEGNAVDPELNDAIRCSGVSHVLAVSGMHVTVLAGAFVWLLRAVWLRSPLALWVEARRAGAALGAILAPLVAAFAGGAPSAWRAALMGTLSYGLVALGHRPNMLAVCAASTLFGMLMEPRDALHPGFVLSVLATSALLTLTDAGVGLRARVTESARVWLATAPFLVVAFGTLQVVSVAANVVLAPVGTALIPLVVLHGLSALWLDPLRGVSAALFETASGAFVVAARLASQLDPRFALPSPSALQGLCLATTAGLWLSRAPLRARLLGSAGLLVILLCEEARLRYPLRQNQARLTFVDVGQGDATLIETAAGEHALIDAGGAILGGPDPGARAVLPLLRALRIDRLKVVMLSHPHPDHYGGLEAILSQIDVDELWDTGQGCAEEASSAACALLTRARDRGTRIVRPDELCGRARHIGPLALRVISPCPGFDEGYGANDNSFVLRVEHGARSVLLTGDVECEAEARLVSDRADLRADVLKVGHHGSRTSTTQPFLAAVDPWLAVISAGRGNRFGHPHPDVIARLAQHRKHVLRLDEVGGVRVLSDGQTLVVHAFDERVALDFASAEGTREHQRDADDGARK